MLSIRSLSIRLLCLVGAAGLGEGSALTFAADYVVTVGGGYVAEQNQASLEANVLFFQRMLSERTQFASHEIFFADGNDPDADLQVLATPSKEDRPATRLIGQLFRRGMPRQQVAYRDHEIQGVGGATEPEGIHRAMSRLAKQTQQGDRVIVYVTAHGKAGPRKNLQNTSISCWGKNEISVAQFTRWLDEFPNDVPVVLVMAQCYAGGFANTIFESVDDRDRLSSRPRIGFFAQQFDLPAAGCRPDIEHDQEFSSYFWGALFGRTRNGEPTQGEDADGNGVVSFDEAFAHSMIVGETIDIPLKSSDILLRKFSRIPGYVFLRDVLSRNRPDPRSQQPREDSDNAKDDSDSDDPQLQRMRGSLGELIHQESPATQRIIKELAQRVGFKIDEEIEVVVKAAAAEQRPARGRPGPPGGFGGPGGRPRGNPARRELLDQIAEKWPELADPETWTSSSILKQGNEADLFDQIKSLPAYPAFESRQKEREEQMRRGEESELRGVKMRRLVETLESIVLAKNLARVAEPQVVEKYKQMQLLEQSSLVWK